MPDFEKKQERRRHRQRRFRKGPRRRGNVVMVRVDEEGLGRIDALVDSGQFGSRSEATAFLIGEGIQAKQELFDKMAEKVAQIQGLRTELEVMIAEDTKSAEPATDAPPLNEGDH